MEKLIRGILDFRKNVLPGRRELFAKLATGQSPDVLFITCSDSRVAPNWFASTDPGDLFVVRNVGNMVPPCDLRGHADSDYSIAAAIDFAIMNLKVSHIVVCGHSGCGAMHALANGIEKLPSSHLSYWLSLADQALQRPSLHVESDSSLTTEDKLSQKSALQQVENLKTYPKIKEKLLEGKLKLHAWWFYIKEGSVYAFNEEKKKFLLIDEEMGESILAQK